MRPIPLSKPVEAHGETITAITFREPTGEDIVACGYPFLIQGEGDTAAMQPIAGAITKYISRLGSIPPSSARALSALDWHACAAEIINFFGTSGPTSSSATSTSPGSGASRPEKSSA